MKPFQRHAFALLTAAVFLGLLLPNLVQQGMFMDGLLYATVAHNEANGFGTFWEPRFSQMGVAGMTHFHEHPPLTFGLQALWFMLLGSGFWVEKMYCLATALIMVVLLIRLWRVLVPVDHPARPHWWWPILLWIIVPQVHWCFQNNMQENTMGIFTMIAVLLVLREKNKLFTDALAGLCVFLALMSKGIPGAFPIAAPVLLWLVHRKGSLGRALFRSAWVLLVPMLLFLLLFQWPEAKASLMAYLDGRLLHRIQAAPTVDYRWRTLQHVFLAMLGPLIMALLLRWRGTKQNAGSALDRSALAMALVGMSGVLPLMLTMVQKSFYMAAALPFLSMSLALFSAGSLVGLLGRMPGAVHRIIGGVAVTALVVITGLSGWLFGQPSRDADTLHDVELIGAMVPPHSLIDADPALWQEWTTQCYLMRYHFLSISLEDTGSPFFLSPDEAAAPFPATPLLNGTRVLQLWERRNGPGLSPLVPQ